MTRKQEAAPAYVEASLKWLKKQYPDSSTELTYETSFQLLVAVILSAQCTDARVNLTTPALFKRFPDAKALAKAKLSDIEKLIKSCGFYRMKALSLKGMANKVLEDFSGEIPKTIEELITLPGVGRKTASVILNQAFHMPAIAVDTHVMRVSYRLGWTHHTNPEKIEIDLKELLPKKDWSEMNGRLVLHGRRMCKARKPLCNLCGLKPWCVYYRTHHPSASSTAEA